MSTDKTIVRRFPFRSKSNPANSYECLSWSNGELSCNCPGWTRRVTGGIRECKHTMLVMEMLANEGTAAVSVPSTVTVPVARKAAKVRRFDFDA